MSDRNPELQRPYRTRAGTRHHAGITVTTEGVNFSVFSRNATRVELLLFAHPESEVPFQIVPLDPGINRTFFFWHVFVEGLSPGACYAWRVDGPYDPGASGFRFDPDKVLLDPRSLAITDNLWNREQASKPGENARSSMRAMVVADDYDWEDDQPLHHKLRDAVIYELHVGGFTRHSSSGVSSPGTFHGIIEKIPYLKSLGITAVELMPVMAFDEQDVPAATMDLGLQNFWGYTTHSYYSPHPGYCIAPETGRHVHEFRDMVKALHRADISVILDIVVNHTAEGGAEGPTINFKGFGNEIFYHLDPDDRSRYLDYTGCGNTVNCNHPLVSNFILHCLEYWVREMHVDGFRFDLASVLARGEDGKPMYHAPVLWNIEFSETLARTSLIAEAWDAGGLYQVGDFPGYRWAEWNGRYRDTIRRFVRGDPGLIAEVASRISGSSDLYQRHGRLPVNSINFVTCHDGFTLNDLVSYNKKHNGKNGEANRDGNDHNLSWNCGQEGESADPRILALRERQAKNFFAILLLSQGVPMLLAGDEVLRTQQGNNNVYCQNNELGWFDWALTEIHVDQLRFLRQLIGFRKRHACLRHKRFLTGSRGEGMRLPDVSWHGYEIEQPLWEDPDARLLAFTLGAPDREEADLHIILNMSDSELTLPLPPVSERRWHRAIDTYLPSPDDITEREQQIRVDQDFITIQPRSVVVLESHPRPGMAH